MTSLDCFFILLFSTSISTMHLFGVT
jgi:hypothetical protein